MYIELTYTIRFELPELAPKELFCLEGANLAFFPTCKSYYRIIFYYKIRKIFPIIKRHKIKKTQIDIPITIGDALKVYDEFKSTCTFNP